MKHAEKRIYTRTTGIKSVRDILNNLPEHHKKPSDAIRMIDRTIGGLLANEQSPFFESYRTFTPILFPSGLEATIPGRDIILILNSQTVKIAEFKKGIKAKTNKKPAAEVQIDVPAALHHPEKGVAQIIGHGLARQLFLERAKILIQLMATEEGSVNENITDVSLEATWKKNALANAAAQLILEDYNPYQTKMLSYINKQAIELIRTLLKDDLPEYHAKPRDAIRQIDWTISELLASKDSPSYYAYLYYGPLLFPSGPEGALPGQDILLMLNKSSDIPVELKHPEKALAQIIGHHFAQTLFTKRGKILEELIFNDTNSVAWQANMRANEAALAVLQEYKPYPGLFDKPIVPKESLIDRLFPCMRR